MIAEIGQYALILALVLSLLQVALPGWGALKGDPVLMGTAGPIAFALFAFIAFSFGALVQLYLASDFTVLNVVENSHSQMPLIYKITSTWGNHEGSMLLWVLVLGLFGALVALFGTNLPDRLKALVLAVQGSIATAFLAFVIFTSNPFLRLVPPPGEGRDLNPILQDPGLAIHPPLLYLGYVGLSVSFSFAVAALIEGRIDAAWARWTRPWTLAAWVFLTLGIAMGSYWAYYELGWGGWWFWDPVENASLMPWLAATALLHSAVVMEKRDALKVWTVLLAILAFSLSLVGTFLVRSGVLTSVHAFATDPARGVFILGILTFFIAGSLALFALRASELRQGGIFAPVSREGALVFNNLFLTAATFSVLVGTLYPLALEAATGAKITVGPPYFNLVFGGLMLPLVFAMPFGPLLAWKRGDLLGVAQRLMLAAGLAVVAAVVIAAAADGSSVFAPVGIALACFVIIGALTDLAERAGLGKVSAKVSLRRLAGVPRSGYGTAIAHMGVGLCLLGIVCEASWSTETIASIRVGDSLKVGTRTLTLERMENRTGPNFRARVAVFAIREGAVAKGTLEASRRTFAARQMGTTEAGIRTYGLSQLYVSVAEETADGHVSVRASYKPRVLLIWLGAVVMAIGGALSLTDRRLRVGAPKPAARRPAKPEPRPVPAE
ncbi:heme lyase CcmF/NrfE family subunit [Xanthobacter tagetidis]|uniref:Heme lyase CcmF/NrfE family subunit n=1 Tax=Xanthobacter tagetidis TaxID=60216 RepID=A0A3L7AJR7_9HYPH|nr:heme lyase CcmF/NrfE family subunit [Xanthobacter tagetidis]MBB6306347.1 cytochrome c-type biogenesis protein CcmF [Xanthobacter tagetidis]RLP79612.1 heme lyase CcmF/NrfE family subunit [Xanthobacter tagetidis]